MRCKSWNFLFYIGFKRAGKCLVCALLPQKLPLVCLAVCLTPDARRDALRAKKKPVRRVPGGLLLSLCPLLCKSKYRPVATKPHGLHLLGSAFPKPCHAAYAAYPAAAMRQSKGGFTMRKRYNTPHRSRVVKTRMTEEEYAEFAERLSACNMSQSEFIRQAITGAAIRPIITVSPVNDELLAAVGKLTAEYGRIGGNLNQIARTLNEWHSPYPQLAGEVRAAVSDLAALKFEILQKVGDAVGNIQTYQL